MTRAILSCSALARHLALSTCVVFGSSEPSLAQTAFERAAQLVQQGDYTAALAVAEQADDPLMAAQTQLHVYHYAGDLDAALEAGRAGLALNPEEPWLLEQTAYVAISLGLGQPAVAWLDTLEEVRPGQAPEWMHQESAALRAVRDAEQTASVRARTVVSVLMALLCGGLLLGALAPRR